MEGVPRGGGDRTDVVRLRYQHDALPLSQTGSRPQKLGWLKWFNAEKGYWRGPRSQEAEEEETGHRSHQTGGLYYGVSLTDHRSDQADGLYYWASLTEATRRIGYITEPV